MPRNRVNALAEGPVILSPRGPRARQGRQARTGDKLALWANTGVASLAGLSALLNAYANGTHATVPWAGATLGVVTPGIVLVLGKVAGLLHKRGELGLARTAAATGAGLLFLSVWHCAVALSALTGSPLALSLPMAVAIDCGLVICEIAVLTIL